MFHADRVIIRLPCCQGQLSRIWKVQSDWLSVGKECCLPLSRRLWEGWKTSSPKNTCVGGWLVSSSHKISIIALVYSVRFLFLLLCIYLIIPLLHLLKQSYYILSLLWIRSILSLCENYHKILKNKPQGLYFSKTLFEGLMCTEGNLNLKIG